MIYMKHKSMIVIIFLILILMPIAGCKRAEKNNIQPTFTLTPTPAQSGKYSPSKTDESWISAYYDYIINNPYDPYLLLIDLNFDGVPELFDIFIAEGSQAYQRGITFMNGKVTPINNGKMIVSAFVGTMTNEKGEKVWYTRSYPSGLHNATGAEIDINQYDCSDLSHITGENLLQISIENTNLEEPDASSVNINIVKYGNVMSVNSQDKKTIMNWYLNDNYSDYGSDWYNNQKLTTEELESLPPLAELEENLIIQEQKSTNVNLSKCYIAENGNNSLDYQLFYNQVEDWYHVNQTKQWDFFD